MTTHINTISQTPSPSTDTRTVETERTRTLSLPEDPNTPEQVVYAQPAADQYMPSAKSSGMGWQGSVLGRTLGPVERIKAFVGKDQVSPTKPTKLQLTENIWVAPSEVLAQPSWRKLWEKFEKERLEKGAKIDGLMAAGTASLFGPTMWHNLTHPADGSFIAGLGLLAAPIIFGTQAIMKWDKLDSMRPENLPPADPEAEGSVTLNPEQLEQLQQQMLALQQAAEQGGPRKR